MKSRVDFTSYVTSAEIEMENLHFYLRASRKKFLELGRSLGRWAKKPGESLEPSNQPREEWLSENRQNQNYESSRASREVITLHYIKNFEGLVKIRFKPSDNTLFLPL